MTHFLYKPHVAGPSDDVTTPDIVVDRVSMLVDDDSSFLPVHRLSSNVEMQVFAVEHHVTPAYAFIACGGGAWRLRNVVENFDTLELSISGDADTASTSLADPPQPADVLEAAPDGELALPRGVVVLCPVATSTISVAAPAHVTMKLSDESRDRALEHATNFVSVDFDQWEKRPWPRYTVGPVGEVQHYI